MYRYRRNANSYLFSHTIFFIRNQFWISIALISLLVIPQVVSGLESTASTRQPITLNSDRIVAKVGPRELQITSTAPPPISQSESTDANHQFKDLRHNLFVITLDGKITAINVDDNGRQLWTADTGSALVDSSLSKIEISRDSGSVRLIPSLIGGLYEKYEEDGRVEALPFDADALLDASFKLHDDSVITGGKHIDTLGLDSETGQVVYSFSKSNTKQQTTVDQNNSRPTLIVKRIVQTVRARSARSGYEKWNFSVSSHELLFIHGQTASIVVEQSKNQKVTNSKLAEHFQYQLQTGVVSAFDDDGQAIWSSSMNAPIAAVWEYKHGRLIEKSLFESMSVLQPGNGSDDDDDELNSGRSQSHPLAFIGEFNSTPYVLVPPNVQKQLIYAARKIASSTNVRRPSLLSWQKAYQKRTLLTDGEAVENGHSRALIGSSVNKKYPLALKPSSSQPDSTAVDVSDKTCDSAGYFAFFGRFNDDDVDNIDDILNTNINTTNPVLTISTVFLGAIMVVLFGYYKHKQTKLLRQQSFMTETSTEISTAVLPTGDFQQLEVPSTPPFQSRYTTEYEHVRFLGRGGFGVVFEAINKLDERRVAIKRVSLKKISGKERALKEIRYLAVLNHPNLIQYYYAWNEAPPIGWQDEEDKSLLIKNKNMTRDSISSFPTSANDSGSINQVKPLGKPASKSSNKPTVHNHAPLIELTFEHNSNPLRLDEEFSNGSNNNNQPLDVDHSSSEDQDFDSSDSNNNTNRIRKRNRLSTTTKSSLSSSSPFFEHSQDSSSFFQHENSDGEPPAAGPTKEKTQTDDGIVFMADEKNSVNENNSLVQPKSVPNSEKELPITYFYFVMELCQPESLRDRLVKRTIDRQQAWSIFDQIVQGIEYIHSKKLIHRDLKPSNILFSMDGTVKIGDFGLVSAFGEDKSAKKKKRDDEKFDHFQPIETASFTSDAGGNMEIGGTILYMSPEQINREAYNQKVDIYAMGIILFELMYPFSTQMERMRALGNVRMKSAVFPADFERDGNNRNQLICRMIRWLLSHSPRDRPKASELRQDTFYQRMLHLELPNPFNPDGRQASPTMTSAAHDLSPTNSIPDAQQHGRISSSPLRRSVSSFAFQSHRNSESADTDSLS